MKLRELAWACEQYGRTTDYDGTFKRFLRVTGGGPPDLENPVHRKGMLKWLNAWSCRQFKVAHHEMASQGILLWSRDWALPLSGLPDAIEEFSDEHSGCAAEAYGHLLEVTTCKRLRAGFHYPVTVGSTGAAKILFALRPTALPPWDRKIRKHLGYKERDPRSYHRYLNWVRDIVLAIIEEARMLGVAEAQRIPLLVGRRSSSLPKLVDEYNWVVITKGSALPSPDVQECFLEEKLRQYKSNFS